MKYHFRLFSCSANNKVIQFKTIFLFCKNWTKTPGRWLKHKFSNFGDVASRFVQRHLKHLSCTFAIKKATCVFHLFPYFLKTPIWMKWKKKVVNTYLNKCLTNLFIAEWEPALARFWLASPFFGATTLYGIIWKVKFQTTTDGILRKIRRVWE
jgi:hypothetical protein